VWNTTAGSHRTGAFPACLPACRLACLPACCLAGRVPVNCVLLHVLMLRVPAACLLLACCSLCRYAGTAALDFLAFLYVALFYNRVVASASSISGKCASNVALRS
jgi:hypothetical protein